MSKSFLKNFIKTIAKETNIRYSIKGYKIIYNLLRKKRIYDINVMGKYTKQKCTKI